MTVKLILTSASLLVLNEWFLMTIKLKYSPFGLSFLGQNWCPSIRLLDNSLSINTKTSFNQYFSIYSPKGQYNVLHTQAVTNKPFLDFANYLHFFFNSFLENHNQYANDLLLNCYSPKVIHKDKNIISKCICMEFIKIVQVNLFARQEQSCRHTEGTQGHSEGRGGWDELGDQD